MFVSPWFGNFADFELKGYEPGFRDGEGKIDLVIRSNRSHGENESLMRALSNICFPVTRKNPTDLIAIKGVSAASIDLKSQDVVQRQIRGARFALDGLGVPVQIEKRYYSSNNTGTSISLWALFKQKDIPLSIGFWSIGEKGKRSEVVGKEAADGLLTLVKSGSTFDPFLSKLLLPLFVLAKGYEKLEDLENLFTLVKQIHSSIDLTDNSSVDL